MLSVMPHQRTATGANADGDGSKRGRRRERTRTATEARAEHDQIPKFECSAFWPDGRGQNFRSDLLRRALLADAVVACSLSNSELIRERQIDEDLPFHDENCRRSSGWSKRTKTFCAKLFLSKCIFFLHRALISVFCTMRTRAKHARKSARVAVWRTRQ
jgi:hypothetical protein